MANDPKKMLWPPTTEELEEFLTKRLFGQPEAIRAVAEQYGFFRSGLKELEESDRHRPIGVFILAGPSRAGKTELGRVLAECFYGTRAALTKLDMNNFKERHAVARLIGSPPGYIGHGDPCEFSTQRLHSKIPGFKDEITHKDQQRSSPRNISTPPPSFLGQMPYQLLMATLRKRGFELLLLELKAIEKAIADIEEKHQEIMLEEKNQGPSTEKEENKEYLKLLQRILEAHRTKLLTFYITDVRDKTLNPQKDKQDEPQRPPGEVPIEFTASQSWSMEISTKTKTKPILIIILDEIEKAHPEVFDFLLNVFDDGRITLGDGNETFFDNALFLLTTNAGAEVISNDLRKKSKIPGFMPPNITGNFDEIVKTKLRTIFKPEFLNRIDKIITFKDLSQQDLRDILDLHLEEFKVGLQKRNYSLIVASAAKDLIVQKALTRPEAQSKAVLDEFRIQIKIPLAQHINNNKIKPGDSIVVDLNTEKQIHFLFRKKPAT